MMTRGKRGFRQLIIRLNLAANVLSPLPKMYRATLNDESWRTAMQREFDALHANHTWDFVPHPASANMVTGRWIFRHKFKPNGSLEHYKACWVLRGFFLATRRRLR